MIMPLEWWMEKAFIIFILVLMARMTQTAMRGFVMWAYWYISEQMKAGKLLGAKPTLKGAAGLVAVSVAPSIAQILIKKLEEWASGGAAPK